MGSEGGDSGGDSSGEDVYLEEDVDDDFKLPEEMTFAEVVHLSEPRWKGEVSWGLMSMVMISEVLGTGLLVRKNFALGVEKFSFMVCAV